MKNYWKSLIVLLFFCICCFSAFSLSANSLLNFINDQVKMQCSYCETRYVGVYQCAGAGTTWDCFALITGITACCTSSVTAEEWPCSDLTYDPNYLNAYDWYPANGICSPLQFCDACSPINFWYQDPEIQNHGGPRCYAYGSSTYVDGRNYCLHAID